jgi:branched-chain amino acid transport system ATP-binding protein
VTAGGEILLSLSGVNAGVGGSSILHDVSIDVPSHGVTALLGRNGVGKTSTLLAVMGLIHRTGAITFDGERIDGEPTHRIVQRGIGYVPENREVFSALTVAENLRLAERGPARYDLVFELFPELERRSRQLAGTMSGGQQQMLALGRVLLTENRLLIVDEPTKGLAPNIVSDVAHTLERVAEQVPVLLVEQNLGVVRHLAGPAVVLVQGRVAYSGSASAFLGDAGLTKRLLGISGQGSHS